METVKLSGILCPVCDTGMRQSQIPDREIYFCPSCGEVVHILHDRSMVRLGDLLARNELGDDRVRAAISKPYISTVTSFIDRYDSLVRMFRMDLDEASGTLHGLMAQIENRLEFAISVFAGLDMVWEKAAEGLSALRAARELVSVLPASSRAVRKEFPGNEPPDQAE